MLSHMLTSYSTWCLVWNSESKKMSTQTQKGVSVLHGWRRVKNQCTKQPSIESHPQTSNGCAGDRREKTTLAGQATGLCQCSHSRGSLRMILKKKWLSPQMLVWCLCFFACISAGFSWLFQSGRLPQPRSAVRCVYREGDHLTCCAKHEANNWFNHTWQNGSFLPSSFRPFPALLCQRQAEWPPRSCHILLKISLTLSRRGIPLSFSSICTSSRSSSWSSTLTFAASFSDSEASSLSITALSFAIFFWNSSLSSFRPSKDFVLLSPSRSFLFLSL